MKWPPIWPPNGAVVDERRRTNQLHTEGFARNERPHSYQFPSKPDPTPGLPPFLSDGTHASFVHIDLLIGLRSWEAGALVYLHPQHLEINLGCGTSRYWFARRSHRRRSGSAWFGRHWPASGLWRCTNARRTTGTRSSFPPPNRTRVLRC